MFLFSLPRRTPGNTKLLINYKIFVLLLFFVVDWYFPRPYRPAAVLIMMPAATGAAANLCDLVGLCGVKKKIPEKS
jgi:hypothetical protein